MFRRKSAAKVKILKNLDTSSLHWCNEAVLILVTDGIGALAVRRQNVPDSYYGSLSNCVLELNNTPLAQARLPGCPTCAGMIATGYGIENSNSPELKNISEQLNSAYIDITTSVEIMKPLLSLLPSGLYVIADSIMYPTDGNGHFFWDVSNQLMENSATAAVLTEDFEYVGGFPSFLYPSQSNEHFDEQRVKYYAERLSQAGNWPRAISYHFGEFMSVLLDGHHKVAAAALLGKETLCISIVPMSAMSYKPGDTALRTVDEIYFSDIKIDSNDVPPSILKLLKHTFGKTLNKEHVTYKQTNLISKPWEQKYKDTIKYYPGLYELAESITLGIGNITEDLITECLINQSEENLRKLRFIVSHLARKGDERLKGLALKCGKLNTDPKLMEVSFKALIQIRDDSDVENFFIDYLVDHNDKHDLLKKIADSYWM